MMSFEKSYAHQSEMIQNNIFFLLISQFLIENEKKKVFARDKNSFNKTAEWKNQQQHNKQYIVQHWVQFQKKKLCGLRQCSSFHIIFRFENFSAFCLSCMAVFVFCFCYALTFLRIRTKTFYFRALSCFE